MKPYYQTTPFTTAAASLLTIIHSQNPQVKLSKLNEFDIWMKTAILPTRASSIFALAHYAKTKGLHPKVVVEKREYNFPDYRFYRYTKEDVMNAAFCAMQYLRLAEQSKIEIVEKEITFENIKEELKKNKTILLRVNVKPIRNLKRNSSNYIVITTMNNNQFSIIDPGFAAITLPEKNVKEAFETLETKKFRDHRMIVFEQKINEKS